VTCVILAGHSEGALIAPLAALKVKTCGVISIDGMGRPWAWCCVASWRRRGCRPTSLRRPTTSSPSWSTAAKCRPAADDRCPAEHPPYLISQLTIDPVVALKAAPRRC